MNSKNVEKHAKQVELQKSIKTIRRELLEPFFSFFSCNAVVIHKVHTSFSRQHRPSFIHPFIHSLIHLIRLKCCSTSGQSASVQFKPCCLSWRVATNQKQSALKHIQHDTKDVNMYKSFKRHACNTRTHIYVWKSNTRHCVFFLACLAFRKCA